MSELVVGSIAGLASNDYVVEVASGSQLTQPGMVLQVVSTTKTDTFSAALSAGGSAAITGLNVSITPSSASNKILVLASVNGHSSAGDGFSFNILRDSTAIGIGDSAGSRFQGSGQNHSASARTAMNVSNNVLDAPAATSAITYSLSVVHGTNSSATQTCYVNRSADDSDLAWVGRFASSITLMEIAG